MKQMFPATCTAHWREHCKTSCSGLSDARNSFRKESYSAFNVVRIGAGARRKIEMETKRQRTTWVRWWCPRHRFLQLAMQFYVARQVVKRGYYTRNFLRNLSRNGSHQHCKKIRRLTAPYCPFVLRKQRYEFLQAVWFAVSYLPAVFINYAVGVTESMFVHGHQVMAAVGAHKENTWKWGYQKQKSVRNADTEWKNIANTNRSSSLEI